MEVGVGSFESRWSMGVSLIRIFAISLFRKAKIAKAIENMPETIKAWKEVRISFFTLKSETIA